MGDPTGTAAELRREFQERQRRNLRELLLRERRNRRNGALAGAACGLGAIFTTAAATRTVILWHSFLLETVLCAAAGYALARRGGGVLTGLVLFAVSYLLAFGLRAFGLDPSVVFSPGDLRAAAAVQGNLVTLCFLLAAGGLIGHIISDG